MEWNSDSFAAWTLSIAFFGEVVRKLIGIHAFWNCCSRYLGPQKRRDRRETCDRVAAISFYLRVRGERGASKPRKIGTLKE